MKNGNPQHICDVLLLELEGSLTHLIQKRETCLKVGAVEEAFRVARELQQVKEQIRGLQKEK
jgi:hypothetical protein